MYPLKFQPILKEMIWGGQKIPMALGSEIAEPVAIGECFAISGFSSDLFVVSNGVLKGENLLGLINEYQGALHRSKGIQQIEIDTKSNAKLLEVYI